MTVSTKVKITTVATVFCLVCVVIVTSVIVITLDNNSHTLIETEVKNYLKKYGYMEGMNKTEMGSEDMRKAIKDFQKMAGVDPSGSIDEETMKMMHMPRCGMSDSSAISSRYSTMSPWPKKSFTYQITKYTVTGLSRQQVDREIARAFQVWADHTDLTFRVVDPRLDRRPDIDIKFEVGNHGDGEDNEFDGRGGTLAHAFYPTNGRAHFDDTEKWTVYTSEGTNLFQVAAHEFGHSLGLGHSNITTALMAPYYQEYEVNFKLHKDDVQGIQRLYGRKTVRPPTPNRPPQTQPAPTRPNNPRVPSSGNRLCQDLTFDTIFTDIMGVTYVIKGRQYWELGSTGAVTSPPRDVQTKWAGLPDHVDAAFSHPHLVKTYFFAGAYYWRYQDDRLDTNYPRLISDGFPGIPDNVDAAFVWPRTSQIYFFKGGVYWKYDHTMSPPVASDYPRQIGTWWQGVPDAPDAAFSRADGRTYFAKEGYFARIDDLTFNVKPKVDSGGQRNIGVLFGCNDAVNAAAPLMFEVPTGGDGQEESADDRRSHAESMAKPSYNNCQTGEDCLAP